MYDVSMMAWMNETHTEHGTCVTARARGTYVWLARTVRCPLMLNNARASREMLTPNGTEADPRIEDPKQATQGLRCASAACGESCGSPLLGRAVSSTERLLPCDASTERPFPVMRTSPPPWWWCGLGGLLLEITRR